MRITDGKSSDRKQRRDEVVRRRLIKGYWEGKKVQQYHVGSVDDCIAHAKDIDWTGVSVER